MARFTLRTSRTRNAHTWSGLGFMLHRTRATRRAPEFSRMSTAEGCAVESGWEQKWAGFRIPVNWDAAPEIEV